MSDASAPRVRGQSLSRRLDNLTLRWQARLDSPLPDRVLPWVAAALLFLVLAALSLARARSLEGGADLASYVQGAWLINRGDAAYLTVRETNLFAEQAGVLFYPIAWVTRVLPTIPTLLVLQSFALAIAVVPLWRLARRVTDLRVGAAATLVLAYSLYPAVHNMNQADFHMATLALPAFLGAVYFALTERWWWFALCIAFVLVCRADFGLVVAGLGGLLALQGRRRVGGITAAAGLVWVTVALFVIQPYFSDGEFVHASAFSEYGSSPLGALFGMLTHPIEVLGDITTEGNFTIVVMLLAPVFFLPVLAPRWLLPALPLEILYLVSNASGERFPRVEHNVAITAFIFVATTFALMRIGRRSVERVIVDRRVLGALVLAAAVFFVRDAATSPYRHPWDLGGRDAVDGARLDAADRVDTDVAVRASPDLLPLLAERPQLHLLETAGNPHVRRAASDVDVVVFDESSAPHWDDDARRLFHQGLLELGFERTFNVEGIAIYERGDPDD